MRTLFFVCFSVTLLTIGQLNAMDKDLKRATNRQIISSLAAMKEEIQQACLPQQPTKPIKRGGKLHDKTNGGSHHHHHHKQHHHKHNTAALNFPVETDVDINRLNNQFAINPAVVAEFYKERKGFQGVPKVWINGLNNLQIAQPGQYDQYQLQALQHMYQNQLAQNGNQNELMTLGFNQNQNQNQNTKLEDYLMQLLKDEGEDRKEEFLWL